MARLSKKDEIGKLIDGLRTFCYIVDAEYYKIPVTIIAADETEANELIAKDYPEGNPELVFRGLRCTIAGVAKKS